MLIMLVGLPRHGKTSWLQYKIEDLYYNRGPELYQLSCKEIDELNAGRLDEDKLKKPEKNVPPIYATRDMGSRFRIGRDKWFEPFIVNPYHLSTTNKGVPTQFFLPYAQIFIPEAQKYFSSKQHQNLDAGVYKFFETHGHNHYDIYLDSQVGGFVDARIRAIVEKVIEVQYQTHIYDSMGDIIHTTWHCREFDSIQAYDEYFRTHAPDTYKEVTFEYDGNIRNNYNGFGCKDELAPPAGQQYSMLKPLSAAEIQKLPKEVAIYYSMSEPEYYRKKTPEPNPEGKSNVRRVSRAN